MAIAELDRISQLASDLGIVGLHRQSGQREWLTSPVAHLGGRSRAQALADGFDPQVLVAEATTFGTPA